ncbi:MAG: M16 family metallopeptidase [Alphaproteobacteria bacterium]
MTINISKLANGLTIATDHMPTAESVSIGTWIKIGSRNEVEKQNGIAHLLEHMAFKGTVRRTAYDIAREIEDVGGYLNAYTGRELTAYYARVLPADVGLTVDILADILQNSVFDADELDRERNVILQELGQAMDTPDDIIFDRFQETAFPEQGVGRPVLGQPKVIERLQSLELREYQQSYYSPGQMVLCAAGKVDHDELVMHAEKCFGEFAEGSAPKRDKAIYVGGDYRENRTNLEQVHIVLGLNGSAVHDEDYYTGSVLSNLFGGGMSSRLFQEVREKRGLVYGIQSFMSSLTDGGMFSVYAGTGPEQADELLPVLVHAFRDLAEDISEEEIKRAKTQHAASLLMARESTNARSEALAQHTLGLIAELDPTELVAQIDAVSRADLLLYADKLLQSKMTFAAVGPVQGLLPTDALQAALSA